MVLITFAIVGVIFSMKSYSKLFDLAINGLVLGALIFRIAVSCDCWSSCSKQIQTKEKKYATCCNKFNKQNDNLKPVTLTETTVY